MPTYTVKKGDTLSGIAQAQGLGANWQALGYSGDPRKLQVGATLSWGNNNAPAAPAAPSAPPPSTPTQYLNGIQDNIITSLDPVKIRETAADLVKNLTPGVETPAPISRVALRQKYNEENGIGALEGQLNELQAQENDIVARRRERMDSEEFKTSALNVISGRVSEVERQEQKRLEPILREKAMLQDTLKTRYTIINQMIQDEGLDYEDGVKRYEAAYNRAFQAVEFAYGVAKDAIDFGFKARDEARANLTIYSDAVMKGGVDFNNLAPEQKLMINRLEAQSGLGVGFISTLSAAQGGMKFHSIVQRVDNKGNQYADVIYVDSRTGQTKVESKLIGKTYVPGLDNPKTPAQPKQPAEWEVKQQRFSEMASELAKQKGSDGKVSPNTFNDGRSLWIQAGMSAQDYDNNFKSYVNPAHWWDYGISKETAETIGGKARPK